MVGNKIQLFSFFLFVTKGTMNYVIFAFQVWKT